MQLLTKHSRMPACEQCSSRAVAIGHSIVVIQLGGHCRILIEEGGSDVPPTSLVVSYVIGPLKQRPHMLTFRKPALCC